MKPLRASTEGNVYLEAAQRVQRGQNRFTCCAIAKVKDFESPECDAARQYERLFRPDVAHDHVWGRMWGHGDYDTVEVKHCRLLALCFMAAMVEAGDA